VTTLLTIRTPPLPIDSAASLQRTRGAAARALRTRLVLAPRISGSEWADRYRILSPEGSAQPGPWRTDRVPYLREILDCGTDRETQDGTIVKCSQSAGSEVLLNMMGFYMDQEPSPIMVIQPSVKPMAEAFSKDRVAPMIRDSARVSGKVKNPRARDSGNTVLHKIFPGGQLTIGGANSPAGLASRPVRILLCDELDRWDKSAGTEGDPLSLAKKRQVTFRHRKKCFKVSSPGNEGESRIAKEWWASDQRHFYVPCPHCDEYQPLEWRDTDGKPDIIAGRGAYRLIWEKSGDGDDVVHHPETAAYVCRGCGCTIAETYKAWMLAKGRWVKHNPPSRFAGWHIPGLISPWVRWSDIAAEFLAKKDDQEQLKTFFNTTLGLLFTGMGEDLSVDKLGDRRETYQAEVPFGVGLLTAGVDVQKDRLEVEVRGWGAKEESWLVRFARLHGDPDLPDVWQDLEAMLARTWRHEGGMDLVIRAVMVDSGYKQDAVFQFVKPRQGRRVYASKGVDDAKQPLSRASRNNRDGVKVFTINPNAMKEVLFPRLKRAHIGIGYMHFGTEEQTGVDDAYLLQYGAEKRHVTFVNNQPRVRYKAIRKRNEAIDLYVLNLAALRSLSMNTSQRLDVIAEEVQAEGAVMTAARAAAAANGNEDSPIVTADPPRRRTGWMSALRGRR
jgi:phage terminase large subunit GpA-like protein